MNLRLKNSHNRMPTPPKSLAYFARFYSHFLCPCRNVLSFVTNSYISRYTPIAILFFMCCPSTIAWFIIAATIYPIYAVLSCWRLSHVFKKSLERSHPSLADSDTLSPIILIAHVLWIVASAFHSHPCIMNLRSGFVMFYKDFISNKFSQATARLCISCLQVSALGDKSISAITNAMITQFPSFIRNNFPHRNSPITFTCEIHKTFWPITFRHLEISLC